MKRAYMNHTDEAVTYKVWSVPLDTVKQNHFPMLKSHDILARCIMDHETFVAANGGNYHYGLECRAEFDTTNDEQEVVLKLLYGSELVLMLATVSTPNSVIQVTV